MLLMVLAARGALGQCCSEARAFGEDEGIGM
jgi:hypothetical protein